MNKISFHYNDVKFSFGNRTEFKQSIVSLFKKENISLVSLNVIFCTDDFLLEINRESLNHDYFTDIITFDLSEGNGCIGELYISVDRVKENAKNIKVSFLNELSRVVYHGCLHLCGYKDKSKKDIIEMRNKEDYYLNHYFN